MICDTRSLQDRAYSRKCELRFWLGSVKGRRSGKCLVPFILPWWFQSKSTLHLTDVVLICTC